jgi:hypothetical protein
MVPSVKVAVKADNRSRLWAGVFPFCQGRFEMENKRGQFNDDCKECIHHWLIDESNLGVCKKCGVNKQFCSSWGTIQKSWYAGGSKVHHDVPVTKS